MVSLVQWFFKGHIDREQRPGKRELWVATLAGLDLDHALGDLDGGSVASAGAFEAVGEYFGEGWGLHVVT